jgi:hypothetical protein
MVVGATLLALVAGCDFEHAQSFPGVGASSGGGAAYLPASPRAPTPPAASAPIVAAPREEVVVAAPPVAASGGDVMVVAVPPRHGTVAISGAGVRYTPTPGYLGGDQFSLRLAGARQTVTVSITGASP